MIGTPQLAANRKAYLLAVGLAVAALLVRLALLPLLGDGGPYVGFFLAAAASAGLGGLGPGLVTTILGALFSGFLFPPGGWLHLIDPEDPYGVVRYLISCVFVSYVCGALIDSRERARTAEQRLRESDRIYRAIGESLPFGIWICDKDGRNTYASQSFLDLVGFTQEQCSSPAWPKLLHPDDAESTSAAWQECVSTGGVWDHEFRVLGADGLYHPVLARGVPIRDERRNISHWAGICLDISHQKLAETELRDQARNLERSNRELEQFAFVASHDLQEPLRIVNVYTELLVTRLDGGRTPDLDQYAGFIREGVDKMQTLITDLLSFSRVIHTEAEKQGVDAGAAVQDALDFCGPLLREAGADVHCGAFPVVVATKRHLAQVFQNLISNAVKYRKTTQPVRIAIRSEPADRFAIFIVEDNGIGFDMRYAEQIFGLFKRLHGNQFPGTGLGLAICQRIVERYGGRIWAESQPDVGTKFFFTVPVAATFGAVTASGNKEDSG